MTATHPQGTNPLDEFLPECLFATDLDRPDETLQIDPSEIDFEPVGTQPHALASAPLRTTALNSSTAQLWPMLAAACVALGVSILAFAAFTRFAHF